MTQVPVPFLKAVFVVIVELQPELRHKQQANNLIYIFYLLALNTSTILSIEDDLKRPAELDRRDF